MMLDSFLWREVDRKKKIEKIKKVSQCWCGGGGRWLGFLVY